MKRAATLILALLGTILAGAVLNDSEAPVTLHRPGARSSGAARVPAAE